MKRKAKWIAGIALGGAAVIVTAGIALAAGGNDSEVAISGDALAKATAAALAHTGGGSVTETEVGDEESYYEVEVTLEDGRQVDVQLDEAFNVVESVSDDKDDEDKSGR